MSTFGKFLGSNSQNSDPSDKDVRAAAQRIVEGCEPKLIHNRITLLGFADELSDIGDLRLEFLNAYWSERRSPDRPIPTRDAFHLEALLPAVGNILILSVERGGLDARYRLYGSNVADHAGRDWTGFLVSEMNRITASGLALMYRSVYLAVYQTGRPIFCGHRSPDWMSAKTWLRLILPVSEDGVTCTQFVVGNIPVDIRMQTEFDRIAQHRAVRGSDPVA
jgi:hypothetical protein